jgi:hypothetical protein
MDNYAAHEHRNVREWLATDPRFVVHFIPTHASWMNLVEVWFGVVERQAIRRGVFTSVKDLNTKIRTFIDGWNDRSHPFVWTKTADDILKTANRLTASNSCHEASGVKGTNRDGPFFTATTAMTGRGTPMQQGPRARSRNEPEFHGPAPAPCLSAYPRPHRPDWLPGARERARCTSRNVHGSHVLPQSDMGTLRTRTTDRLETALGPGLTEEMRRMGGNHLKYMLLGGAGVFGALLLLNVPLQSALLIAILMACPLMIVMMIGQPDDHGADGDESQGAAGRHEQRGGGAGRVGHHH